MSTIARGTLDRSREEAVQVARRLAQPLADVLELGEQLLPLVEESIHPRHEDRAGQPLAPALFHAPDLVLAEHEKKGMRRKGERSIAQVNALSGGLLRAFSVVLALASLTHAAPRPEASDITFFVASDTHFGYRGMEDANRRIAEQMNALPGREYPAAMGGRVTEPRGVLILGDMTDYSTEGQWQQFETVYGLTGKEGLLRFPVFEAVGNHDSMDASPVPGHIERRHGGLMYSFDWDRLHVVCLGMYPSAARIRWLREDLRTVKADRPLVVFFHYGMEGPYSESWESQEERTLLAQALEGRRVAALLHGHWHMAGHYRWRGHEVFRPGSPKHSSHTFLVVRLRAKEIAVGFWNFDEKDWEQAVVRPLR
jgi:hypothetical protein